MSQNIKYEQAIAFFNRAGKSTAEDIRYTYDSDKNILIQHHENIDKISTPGGVCFIGGLVSGSIMANSFYNAATAPTAKESQDSFPDISLGFTLFCGIMFLSAKRVISKSVNAVDREVTQSTRNTQTPVM